MCIITLHVMAPVGQLRGIQEELSMYCEKYGDVRVVSVVEIEPEQMKLEGMGTPWASRR